MKDYDFTEKAKHELETRRSLEVISARLARHEKVSRIILVLVVLLAGLSLTLLAVHLFDLSN